MTKHRKILTKFQHSKTKRNERKDGRQQKNNFINLSYSSLTVNQIV